MRKGIYILPNTLTLCGMFMGFYSILASLKGLYVDASWAIIIAMVFDGLDGWVARLTHSTTRFGIELDSLSDLVAFGVAPAVMLFKWNLASYGRIGWSAAFLFMACGALRLARYNVQMGSAESKSFTGMPIPGAATIVATMVIFYYEIWETVPAKNIYILSLNIYSGCPYGKYIEVSWRKGDRLQQEEALLDPRCYSCGLCPYCYASSDCAFYICNDLFVWRYN